MIAFSAQARKPVDSIDAGSTIVTGIDGTIINVDITHFPCVSWFTGALVTIYLVNAPSIITGIAFAVIYINLTVNTCSSFGADAEVGVLPVLAGASILAWLTETFIYVGLTQAARVTRAAETGEGCQAVFTGAVMTRVGETLVHVSFTVLSRVTFGALACVHVGPINTFGAIFTGGACTLVNVKLALASRESCGALALVVVDLIDALPIVETGHAGALIGIDLAEDSLVPWHADAMKASDLIQTRSIVLAGVRQALIYVEFTSTSHISLLTFTLEGTFCVDTLSGVLTRVCTKRAFINVLVTGWADITQRTGTDGPATDWIGITVGAFLTGITNTSIIQVTQQTCASGRAFAEERGHPIVTRSSCVTGRICAVINVLAAVVSSPAVHTHAVISTLRVQARPTVLTGIGHQITLIHVFSTELTCPLRLALAVVCVHSIYAGSSI